MGIPSYFSHVVREHRDIIKKLGRNMVVNNLYLDSNGIIYECVHNSPINDTKSVTYEAQLIKSVCQRIHEYIETVQPRNRVVVAFDGVAPVAKLNQQRERRYKSWLQRQILDEGSASWDTCAITPGTAFMKALGKGVCKHFSRKTYDHLQITVTGADEQGEGEHKIFGIIREDPDYHSKTTTAVYGLDADLIMLALSHLAVAPQLYLYRETPHFIKSIDNSLEPGSSYVVDVPRLSDRLGDTLVGLVGGNSTVRHWFVIMFSCVFSGNDFLPHFPSLNIRTDGIDKLMAAYKKLCKNKQFKGLCIIEGDSEVRINWRTMRDLVNMLAESELDAFVDEHISREKRSRHPHKVRDGENIQELRLMSTPMRERGIEVFINPEKEGWEWRYYKALLDVDINNERKRDMRELSRRTRMDTSLLYPRMQELTWTYAYPYPPLLSDLVQFIPYFDTTFVPIDGSDAVSPLTQLSYVLPRASLNLLPTKLFRSLIKERPHWYDERVKLLWAYCRYFWESHAILPEIDLGELSAIVTKACY